MSKFAVGEVCEAYEGDTGAWVEVTIVAIGYSRGSFPESDYTIETPMLNRAHGDYLWGAREKYLRKKRPPQQDNEKAEDWFIKDLNKMLKCDTVEAVIKGGRIITKVGDKRIEAGSLWELVEKMGEVNEP